MSLRDAWKRLDAEAVRLTGNAPVVLDDDRKVGFVESGSVAVYCVEMKDGELAGPRRFLSRIGSGQALFSAPAASPSETPDGLRFVFVPTGEATMRVVELDALWDERATHPENAAAIGALVDGWVTMIASFVKRFPVPSLSTKLEEQGRRVVDDGTALASSRDRVVWVSVEEGELHGLGSPDIAIDAGGGHIALGAGLWAKASGETAIVSSRSAAIPTADALVRGIARLHGIALTMLRYEIRVEEKLELARLDERREIQRRRKSDAVHALAAVLESDAESLTKPTGSPIFLALTEIGRAIHTEVRPPQTYEKVRDSDAEVDAIARASQIRTRRVVLSGEWWKQDCGHLLVFDQETGAPYALIRERKRYRVFDPADGSTRRLTAALARSFETLAVMPYRRLPDGKLKLSDLLRFGMQGRGRDLALVVFAGVTTSLLGMLIPIATGLLMDVAIPDADRRLLFEMGGALLAVAFGMVIFYVAQSVVLLRVQIASEAETQSALWDRMLRLRPSFFRRFSSGDLQSRVMAVQDVGEQLSGATMSSLFAGVMAMLNLGLLYYYSPKLTLIAVGVALVATSFTLVISYFVRRNTRDLLEIHGQLFGLEIQLINGAGKLRVAGAGDRAFSHWIKSFSRQLDLWARNFALQDRLAVFSAAMPTISSILLFLTSYQLLAEGRSAGGAGMSLGAFLAFNAAYGIFLRGITSLTNGAVKFMDILVKGKRVQPLLEEEPEIDASKADPGKLAGGIELKDVRFRYSAEGPDILKGVSLSIEPGEFVALVGPSGSGKSTALRMLLGFDSPQEGTVLYDQQDLASLDVLAVRRQLGVVLQGGSLDAGTIFENIASGNVISLDQAWAAAEEAGLADDVRAMPMGMHTMVSMGGGNLSGGQRQRLLIARALAQRPQILLFDEATSALDNRTQAIVSESLERLAVTRVVVAHRLSTIRDADKIYVLQDGRVVQGGSFDDLMHDDDGLFARMMKRQMA